MVDARISRKPGTLELSVSPIGWLMESGDVISFTSQLMGENITLWRIEELEEDEGKTNISLKPYDDNFYTPDPSVIPAPAAPAQPPTGEFLSPVSGFSLIDENGEYYLTWDPVSIANITWYAIDVYLGNDTSDETGTVIYSNQRMSQPPFKLSNITVGSYTATITPFFVNNEGPETALIFNIAAPVTPTVTVIAGNLEVQIIPRTPGIIVNQVYELEFSAFNNQVNAINYGESGSFTVSGLSPLTDYYYWVRAVNPIGVSAWVSGNFTTTNDATAILALIGEDITNQILPDVITAVQEDLQTVVDNTLVDYSTTLQVETAISEALELAGLEDNEDVRISLIEQVNSVFDTNDRKVETKQVSVALADETTLRAGQYTLLTAADAASVARLDQAESDINGNATAISSVEGLVNNPTTGLSASYNLAQTAKVTADSNASSITVIQNKVDNPISGLSATFTLAGQAKATADGNVSAIAGVSTTASNAQGTATSALTLASTLDNSLDSYRASAQLKVDANGSVSFIQLDATPTVSQVKFKADQIFFLNNDNVPVVYWDTNLGRYIFDGTIYAENIEGDVVEGVNADLNFIIFDGSGNPTPAHTLLSFTVSSAAFNRICYISSIPIEWGNLPGLNLTMDVNGSSTNVLSIPGAIAQGDIPSPFIANVPANTTVTITVRVTSNTNVGTAIIQGDALINVMKKSQSITIN